MATLITISGGKHKRIRLESDRYRVGRAPENELQIDDVASSRRHCEFIRQGETWRVRDLGSLNGTFVNELTITEHTLEPGDRVQVGATYFYFVPDTTDERRTSSGSATDPNAPARGPEGFVAVSGPNQHQRDAQAAASRRLRNFAALLEVAKAVSRELEPDRLLRLIIDKSMELTGAERGFLILLNDGEPVFKVAHDRDGNALENPEALISNSVLEKVSTTGEPVVTINAQNDLGAFVSIVALEVRSLLCVPLTIHERVIGAIYLDCRIASREFDDESLNLLLAFSDQAAIALENARLYQEALDAKEREKRVRKIFQKYVPADVVNSVLELAEGDRLSAKLTATVLFSDIRSFTSISERLAPEQVVAFLNDYLQRMVQIVDEHGGIVDKFVGDAILAVFGAPVSRPDDAAHAIRAGLQMLDELERFNADQAAHDGVQISIGIGVHTGDLIAGNMGSDKKMEYTVIGDTVNTACRIESLTKDLGFPLLVSRACLEAAGPERFDALGLPPVHVKGKQQPLHIHVVNGIRTEADPPPSPERAVQVVATGTKTPSPTANAPESAAHTSPCAPTLPLEPQPTKIDRACASTLRVNPEQLFGETPSDAPRERGSSR